MLDDVSEAVDGDKRGCTAEEEAAGRLGRNHRKLATNVPTRKVTSSDRWNVKLCNPKAWHS